MIYERYDIILDQCAGYTVTVCPLLVSRINPIKDEKDENWPERYWGDCMNCKPSLMWLEFNEATFFKFILPAVIICSCLLSTATWCTNFKAAGLTPPFSFQEIIFEFYATYLEFSNCIRQKCSSYLFYNSIKHNSKVF